MQTRHCEILLKLTKRYRKSHPLGDRARKLKEGGGVIVRFEMPWNVWCDGCKNYIAQGTIFSMPWAFKNQALCSEGFFSFFFQCV